MEDDPRTLLCRLESLLPSSLLPDLSNAHPLSLLLYDRGLTFLEGTWEGKPFLAVDSHGYTFLPAPPPWTLPPEGSSDKILGAPRFWITLADTLLLRNNGVAGHLDGLPDTFCVDGFSRPDLSETEVLLASSDWNHLTGSRHKTHRWEKNQLFRKAPGALVRPWEPRFRRSSQELLERFFSEKAKKTTGDQDRILLEDQWRAHEKALASSEELGLSGFVVLSDGRVRGIGWFAVLPDRRGAIQYLEAREPGLTGIAVLLTYHFFLFHPDVPLLNIQGDAQNPGIQRSKRLDLPCRISPAYRLGLDPHSR